MRRIRHLSQWLLALAVSAWSGSPAWADPNPNAQTIRLRTSCGADADCFTSFSALNSWINATRQPTAASPLLVDVGLGEFEGQFLCATRATLVNPFATNFSGYVTFRGQSRVGSVLKRDQTGGIASPVIVSGCQDLSFENLTVRGARYGVVWGDGGSSTWSNVDVEAGPALYALGWYESSTDWYFCDRSAGGATHYWYGSKITVKAGTAGAQATPVAIGYNAACGETWFYGGEITVQGAAASEGGPGSASRYQAAVVTGGPGQFQAFGSLLRSIAGPIAGGGSASFNPSLGATGLAAVIVGFDVSLSTGPAPGGHFHLHGGNATADASAAGGNSTSLLVLTGGVAHTPGASFVSRPGTGGTAYRLTNDGGTAISPLLWQASTERPSGHHDATGVLQSDDGHDLFVETDCDETGDCDSPGGEEAHLMVINPTKCGTADPWFDVVTGRCRNDVTP
jgi:hypothetical protein